RDVCGMEEVKLDVRLRKTPQRMPVTLSRKELFRLLEKIEPLYRPLAELQYGAGLRLKELVRLRVKDIDWEQGLITIRGGKGDKDRVTILPEKARGLLRDQIAYARTLYEKDRAEGRPGVEMGGALGRKFSRAAKSWEWMWVFPAREPWAARPL
ncbi:tyrosine-type recombinase/integrase, partial [Roseibacillus ishigakijimensis]|uniref:tyrosine-type recombinase/integrase n=1 Tax=Roseibacillus ishigakijimensis TaxID=454146 RepID=UPI00362A0713